MPKPAPEPDFPLKQYLGFELTSDKEGRVRATLTADERHLNPHGGLHGGVLFTMVDTAMGKAAMALVAEGQRCATIELSMRYLRPVSAGRVEAEVTVLRRGRRVIHMEGRVWRVGDERPVAVMSGSFAVVDA